MAATWLEIAVELVEGRGERFWPRPGRVFACAPTHTFGQLAAEVDAAFGRWDLGHLCQFELDGGVYVTEDEADWLDGVEEAAVLSLARTRLGRLDPGERFLYEFDLGDGWLHVCTVGAALLDPAETLGGRPRRPVVIDGWGALPDQYGRRFRDDDGESPEPPDTEDADLPAFRSRPGA